MLGTVLIAIAILLLIIAIAYGAQRLMAARVLSGEGSVEKAQSDADNPVPAVLTVPDDSTPAGDTPDAHDEISPHDVPLGHPGRQAAEDMASQDDAEDPGSGTTRGHEDPSESPPDAARS